MATTLDKSELAINLPEINVNHSSFPKQHPIATTRDHNGNPFPRIILKDHLGIPLDTDTGYQRALYEAKVCLEQCYYNNKLITYV